MRTRWVGAVAVVVIAMGLGAAWVHSQPADTQPAGEESPPYVQTDSLMVVVAASGDTVWGYTKETGKWYKVTLPRPASEPIRPLAGKDVVIFQEGNSTYALGRYSKAGWNVLVTTRQPQVMIMDDWVIAEAGDSIYGFSAKVGKWSGINVKTNRSSNWDE